MHFRPNTDWRLIATWIHQGYFDNKIITELFFVIESLYLAILTFYNCKFISCNSDFFRKLRVYISQF